MIRTHSLSKSFGDTPAVADLTLDIGEGEVFGFLGPNGAGKTTTVRLLCCLIAPTSGSASVVGLEVGRDDAAIRRNVGILTETPGLYDRLSARRNLTIFARLYEVERVDYQVEKYLRLLGLWERRDDPVGEFSKGMRQKLAIGRALLHEPRVVFLDEPTAALDPQAAKLIRDFIAELKSEGRTIFLCTHNLDEADRLCDRVAVFKTSLRVVDTPLGLRRRLFGRMVTVDLGQDAGDYGALVADVPGVNQVEADGRRLVLAVDDPQESNPEVVRKLVAAGAKIIAISEVGHSLEDVYLQLVES